ncbi:MAG: succinylglutamate desuccinylase/aspartoacylase family protein [Myxococcota bacterium]
MTSKATRAEPLEFLDETIRPGTRKRLNMSVARLPVGMANVAMPVMVLHGSRPGPSVWISAALHGDEVNGIEIARCAVERLRPKEMAGTVYVVPIVNVYGFLAQDRYLPDGRDLNRSFPGSRRGSLASRVAHLFTRTIVDRCVLGLDLHTATQHRENLPQIRTDLTNPVGRRCAEAFGAPAIVHAKVRDGSLRSAAAKREIPVLVYEAGEAHRFDERAIHVGVQGVLRVLAELGIRERGPEEERPGHSTLIERTTWVRARRSGILRPERHLGDRVDKGDLLGRIGDAFDAGRVFVKARVSGVVVGRTQHPLVHQGDALFNLGVPGDPAAE